MKCCVLLLTVVLAGLIPNTLAVAAGEKLPDVAKRYIFKKDQFKDVEISFLADGIEVKVSKPGAMVSTLTFSEPCDLKIVKKDKTLLATKEGVKAKDDKGKTWKSKKVKLDGKEVNAFFLEG